MTAKKKKLTTQQRRILLDFACSQYAPREVAEAAAMALAIANEHQHCSPPKKL